MHLEISTFFEVASSHVHFARVRIDGGPPIEHLLTSAHREVALTSSDDATRPGASFAAYLRLGVEHILEGFDHLAFLLALLILLRRLRDVVFVVSGFTIGHSITLSLAVLGWVQPDTGLIEALIGFTIALVAIENVGVASGRTRELGWISGTLLALLALRALLGAGGPGPIPLLGLALFACCYLQLVHGPDGARRLRPTVTALFGLVHGFGFASVLLEVGVPDDRLVGALVGFNLGVELGQLAVVLLLVGFALLVLRRWPGFPRAFAIDVTSAALCALGLYWFTQRAYA
jgi:hypothetical protein